MPNDLHINPVYPPGETGDVIRDFFITEFEKDLEKHGVDTVCFMGYGYNLADIKIGAEFYFSYLYYGRQAAVRNGTVAECLRACLLDEKHNGNNTFFERYKIIQKYKYFDTNVIDYDNKKIIPVKERRTCVKIKNLRTAAITIMAADTIDYAPLFCWVTCE